MLIDSFFRYITLALLISRFIYWFATKKKADIAKPKTRSFTTKSKIRYAILYLFWILLGLQLLGLMKFLQFPRNALIQTLGFILALTGVAVSIAGKRELNTNWAHGGEYQIKKGQELVTTGIYGSVRHPIYLGLLLCLIGGELVAQSYFFLFFLIVAPYHMYVQGKKEETLLQEHFGKRFAAYKKKTKMFIPYFI